jgi:Insecticide toxin TcdB middle/N-terminal region
MDLALCGSGYVAYLYSEGNSLSSLVTSSTPCSTTSTSAAVTDQNGDGLDDLILVSTTSPYQAKVYLHSSSGQPPDLLNVTDVFGNSVSPTLVSITQLDYGHSDADATYPLVIVESPVLYVTSQYVASNGIGGTYTVQYYYYDLCANLQGRETGAIWLVKSRGDVLENVEFIVDTKRQRLTMDFPGEDRRTVFEGAQVHRALFKRGGGSQEDRAEGSFDGHKEKARATPA